MTRRGLLSIDDTIYKSQPLLISGAAKILPSLKVQDSIPIDSQLMKSLNLKIKAKTQITYWFL
jgi:hypothetical protein